MRICARREPIGVKFITRFGGLWSRGGYSRFRNRDAWRAAQREADAAREKLEEVGEDPVAPNRNPPTVASVDNGAVEQATELPIDRADAAE